jgi:hypothetical protein
MDDEDEYEEPPSIEDLSENEVLAALIKTREVDTRVELVWRLSQLASSSDSAYEALLAVALRDKSPKVRAEALDCLSETRDLTDLALRVLPNLMFKERSTEVKIAAVRLFHAHLSGRPGIEQCIAVLVHVWEHSRGDLKDHSDTAIRELTGCFAEDLSHEERLLLKSAASSGQ